MNDCKKFKYNNLSDLAKNKLDKLDVDCRITIKYVENFTVIIKIYKIE